MYLRAGWLLQGAISRPGGHVAWLSQPLLHPPFLSAVKITLSLSASFAIIEYLELEGTHKDHRVPAPSPILMGNKVCSALELLVAGLFISKGFLAVCSARAAAWESLPPRLVRVRRCRRELKAGPAKGTRFGTFGAGVVTRCPLVHGITVFNVLSANLSFKQKRSC